MAYNKNAFVLLVVLSFAAIALTANPPPPLNVCNPSSGFIQNNGAAFTLGGGVGSGNGGQSTSTQNGQIRPCDWQFWIMNGVTSNPEDYLSITINITLADNIASASGTDSITLYVKPVNGCNPPNATDPNLLNYPQTVAIPGNSLAANNVSFVELICNFRNNTQYWIALNAARGSRAMNYFFQVAQRRALPSSSLLIGNTSIPISGSFSAPVYQLTNNLPVRVYNESLIANIYGVNPLQDSVRNTRYFSFYWDPSNYVEGTYLSVVLSAVQTTAGNLQMLLNYGSVPQPTTVKSSTTQPLTGQSCIQQNCLISGTGLGACSCTPSTSGDIFSPPGNVSCRLDYSTCRFRYGWYYIAVIYPPIIGVNTPNYVNYTITATIVQPLIQDMQRNVTYRAYVQEATRVIQYDKWQHYRLNVTSGVTDLTQLFARLDNVVGGQLGLYVHLGAGRPSATQLYDYNLAGWSSSTGTPADQPSTSYGFPDNTDLCDTCYQANAFCRTCAACNVVIPKCLFTPGTWYFSVRLEAPEQWTVPSRLRETRPIPASYTLTVNWVDEASPLKLSAGVPASRYLGENLYDFFVLDVPQTMDTWLFVEMYVDTSMDQLSIDMLWGDKPGRLCYAQPDYRCQTNTYTNAGSTRESCSFMINACNLQQGQLYISIYGEGPVSSNDVTKIPVGINTFYQVPVRYTLWAEFDTPRQITNAVSYSESVDVQHYNHYYIRADNVEQGSSMIVEFTNIQSTHAAVKFNGYVNYNFLAGECPCYNSLFNCTGAINPSSCPTPGCDNINRAQINNLDPDLAQDPAPARGSVTTCCKITVDSCNFRSGIWYIGVQAYRTDSSIGESLPPVQVVGYTLTATIIPAPPIKNLVLGEIETNEVGSFEYVHYHLIAQPIPANDLVLELTWVQNNCIDTSEGSSVGQNLLSQKLRLYVNYDNLAISGCFYQPYACVADSTRFSRCTVLIPWCQWNNSCCNNLFVSVYGDFVMNTNGPLSRSDSIRGARYTLRTNAEEIHDTELVPGQTFYGRLLEERYDHYYIDVVGEPSSRTQAMEVALYYNADESRNEGGGTIPTINPSFSSPRFYLSMNLNERAGGAFGCIDCYRWQRYCQNNQFCHWLFQPCDLAAGRYFFSIFTPRAHFFGRAVEYSFFVGYRPMARPLLDTVPVTAHIYPPAPDTVPALTQVQHYFYEFTALPSPGTALVVEVGNVKRGSVVVYVNQNKLAGRCPCYANMFYMECPPPVIGDPVAELAKSIGTNGACDPTAQQSICRTKLPDCMIRNGGVWYIGVYARDPIAARTSVSAIGYTIEVRIEQPNITSPSSTITVPLTNPNTNRGSDLPGDFIYSNITNIFAYDFIPSAQQMLRQRLDNEGYLHYQFDVGSGLPSNFFSGNFLMYFNISNVQPVNAFIQLYFGALRPPFERVQANYAVSPCPGNKCHTYQLCSVAGTTGTTRQLAQCFGFIPPCTFAASAGPYYLSFRAATQYRFSKIAIFDFSVYLQAPITLQTTFRNVTHALGSLTPVRYQVTNVDASASQILEIFFTNIQPVLASSNFTVYVYPGTPAGLFSCSQAQLLPIPSSLSGPCANSICVDRSHRGGPTTSGISAICDPSVNNGQCNVTVNSCILNGVGGTWWVSVVPSSPGFSATVSYTIAYRQRNIVGSGPTSLNGIISSRSLFSSSGVTLTVGETWAHYTVSINVPAPSGFNTTNSTSDTAARVRVYILTTLSGVAFNDAVVYIRKTTGSIYAASCCRDYECHPTEGCDTSAKWFVAEACCNPPGNNQWWIAVRNIQDGATLTYNFAVYQVNEPAPTSIDNIVSSPNSLNSVGNLQKITIGSTTSSGIDPQNFHNYYITVSNQFTSGQSLVIALYTDNTGGLTPPVLYVRKGYRPGNPQVYSTAGETPATNCYTYAYTCDPAGGIPVPSSSNTLCYIDIPSCVFTTFSGEAQLWYISIYSRVAIVQNPTNPNQLNVGYSLSAYWRPTFGINTTFTGSSTCQNASSTSSATRNANLGTNEEYGDYVHYSFIISTTQLNGFNGVLTQSQNDFYHLSKLQFYINPTNGGPVVMNVRGPRILRLLNGQNTQTLDQNRINGIPSLTTSNTSSISPAPTPYPLDRLGCPLNDATTGICAINTVCAIAFLPCFENNLYLVPGEYFVSLRVGLVTSVQYTLCVELFNIGVSGTPGPGFQTLTTASSYAYDRVNTGDTFWNVDQQIPSSSLQAALTTQAYKFIVNPNDLLGGTKYLQFNFSTSLATVGFRVIRDDCTIYNCANLGSFGANCIFLSQPPYAQTVVVDDIGLAPCSVVPGTYYLVVDIPQSGVNIQYNFTAFLRQAPLNQLFNSTPVYARIWQQEYQAYNFTVQNVQPNVGAYLQFVIDGITCGQVEAYVRRADDLSPNPTSGPLPSTIIAGPPFGSEFRGSAPNIQPDTPYVPYTGPDSPNPPPHWALRQTCKRCAISYCRTSATAGEGMNTSSCAIRLDTCQVHNGVYFLTIRGINQEYQQFSSVDPPPGIRLQRPIDYRVTAFLTTIPTSQIGLSCPLVVSFFTPRTACNALSDGTTNNISSTLGTPLKLLTIVQYTVKVVAAGPGASLRFTLEIPAGISVPGTMIVNRNVSVPFLAQTSSTSNEHFCSPAQQSCTVSSAGTPVCALYFNFCPSSTNGLTGVYYIWVNSPQGSRVRVERNEPYIPIIVPNVSYNHSVAILPTLTNTGLAQFNPPSALNAPYRTDLQYYRIDLDSSPSTFLGRVWLDDVRNGDVLLTVYASKGIYSSFACQQYVSNIPFLASITVLNDNVPSGSPPANLLRNRFITIQRCEARWRQLTSYFITVQTVSQVCASCHVVTYSLRVSITEPESVLVTNVTQCGTVPQGFYNHYRLRPSATLIDPTNNTVGVLQLRVTDVDRIAPGLQAVSLRVRNGAIATIGSFPDSTLSTPQQIANGCNFAVLQTQSPANQSCLERQTDFPQDNPIAPYEWICRYDDLRVSIYGDAEVGAGTIYNVNATNVWYPVTAITNGVVNSSCGGIHDFYTFTVPNLPDSNRYLRVLLTSVGTATVYVNKNSVAWTQCWSVSSCSVTAGTCNANDWCTFASGAQYWLTVSASAGYTLNVSVSPAPTQIGLNQISGSFFTPASTESTYIFTVGASNISPNSYLIVQLLDVRLASYDATTVSTIPPLVGNPSLIAYIGYSRVPGSNPGLPVPTCIMDTATVSGSTQTSGQGVIDSIQAYDGRLLVTQCQLIPGTYIVRVTGGTTATCDGVRYSLRPTIVNQITTNFPLNSLSLATTNTNGVLQASATASIASIPNNDEYHFYTVTPSSTSPSTSFAVVRLSGVTNGVVEVRVKRSFLVTPTRPDAPTSTAFPFGVPDQLLPFQSNTNLGQSNVGFPGLLSSCFDYVCNTKFDMSIDDDQNDACGSCAVVINSCANWYNATWYIVVSPIERFDLRNTTGYTLTVTQYNDFISLDNNVPYVPPTTPSFGGNNQRAYNYNFYSASVGSVASVLVRVSVQNSSPSPSRFSDAVWVTVRDSRCYQTTTWLQNVYCPSGLDSEVCEIQIPTRATHPGGSVFYIEVYGFRATYSITFSQGLSNCEIPTQLSFCSGIVNYPTWRWSQEHLLDREASCLFTDLYAQFAFNQDCQYGPTRCQLGASSQCNATLQRFACYETFKRCDSDGFFTGTCRQACDSVVYFCQNWFESVSLGYYNCTSGRYLDASTQTCSGSTENVAAIVNPSANPNYPQPAILRLSPSGSLLSGAQAITFNVVTLFVCFITLLVFLLN